jgi:hypothetical protein
VVNEDKSLVRKDPAGLEPGVSLNNSRVIAAVKLGHLTTHEERYDAMGLGLTDRQTLLGFRVTQRLRYHECCG